MEIGPNTNTLTNMNPFRSSLSGMQTYTKAYSFASMDGIVHFRPSEPRGDNPLGPAAIVQMSQEAQSLMGP